ncbi:hypothetical protein P3T23_008935 [Paraburkholderia sp. GAS448]
MLIIETPLERQGIALICAPGRAAARFSRSGFAGSCRHCEDQPLRPVVLRIVANHDLDVRVRLREARIEALDNQLRAITGWQTDGDLAGYRHDFASMHGRGTAASLLDEP